MVKNYFSCMVTCVLLAFMAFTANAAAKIRLQFVFDKGAMDYISQAGADYDDFAASCVTRMNTVLSNSRLNDYFTYELAGTTLLPGVDNTNPATGYTEGWAALCGNRGDEWAGMLQDRYNNAADVVVLLINTGSYAGATGNSHPFTGSGAEYAINYAGSAFSVCSIMTAAREIQGVASGHQVLSHEVAHTLGCGHPDTQDRQPGPQSTTYASGMQFKLPQGKETALPPSASVTQDVTAYYGTTLMGYSERFFKHTDGTYMTRAEVLAETGWTDAGEGVVYWDNTNGEYGSSYPNGVWTYCYLVPYFSSPNLYFSNVTVPYGMELTDGVVTVYDQAQYDAMSAEDKAKVVPMGDATHNNRQVLIDNYQYASRWHLGVKFSKSGTDNVVNGASDKISLAALSDNCTIYYTTDGTEPTKSNGTLYTEPFSLTTAATVKARSYDADGNAGDVLSKSYTILPLATALGNTELTWTVGNYPWYVEEGVARSRKFASAEEGNQSVLTTTIVGPATVNFDYKVLSAGFAMSDYADKFIAMLDGVEYLSLKDTNVDDWSAIDSIEVPSGEHTLSLVFNLNEYWGDAYAAVRNVSIIYDDIPDEPAYDGPAPIAVWVAGEFGDDRSAHGGLEFALNGNTTNAVGEIVIGNATTLGATVAVPSGTLPRMSMLVKYSVPAGGAPVAQSVPASLFSTYDMGALAGAGSSALAGYWLDVSTVKTGSYSFSSPAQTMPQEGYVLISNWTTTPNSGDHGTAVYSGETLSALVGGEVTGLRFTGDNNYITAIGVGGPTVAGTKPWQNMVIKSVALFDEWVATNVIANYKFPAQGAEQPEDSDRYAIEPVASWVNDFKTTTKGDYTLSVSGTTAAKDDTFGGTLTIGDAAAIIDTTTADSTSLTVLVKYRSAPSTVNAAVTTFGTQHSNGNKIDVGAYTKSDKTLAVNRTWNGGNNAWYDLSSAATLSSAGGYLLCARKESGMQIYTGASLDSMTGGNYESSNITFSGLKILKVGLGGGAIANANTAFTTFDGFVVEKVVVFNGYYTPGQIRYVPNPEDSDTLSIASGATWNFAAGETKTYTNIGTLNSGGTIAITNAATLAEGYYTLATWTTAQKYTTTCAGYGSVGTLLTDGLPEGLSARLIYGAKAIYLRVDNVATQATRKPIVILPYGDSITEGFTAEHMGANYRILLYQKLELLGFKVKSAGIYDKDDGYNSVDPSGKALSDDYKWHSAKHGAVTGRSTSTASGRSDLEENVDTVCAQAGKPDVVLLHIGINDLVSSDRVSKANMSKAVFNSWTNVVWGLVDGLPETKIVVSTVLYGSGGQKTRTIGSEKISLPELIDDFNARVKAYMGTFPEGRVFLADLNDRVKSDDYGIIYKDTIHPDWWGHDQMAEGWLEVITNQFTASQNFSSATPIVAPTDEQLGAAAKDALAEYRKGFELCRRIDITGAGNNVDVSNPYAVEGDGVTEGIEKVGYFVEYVRADNNVNKWVWVDMDAFGTTLDAIGLPSETHQQVVTKLHVKSNHNGIDDVAADDDTVNGFVEFTPFDYNGNVSGVDGAPAGYGSVCDWNDKVVDGNKGCMQVHRVVSTSAAPGGQVLFAYNNWNQSSTVAEFGIGNFSQHFHGGTQTYDYSETKNLSTMNATNYVVKTIEIWTKAAEAAPVVVAQIGETPYTTLQGAIDAANASEAESVEIELLATCTENVELATKITVRETESGQYTGKLSGSGTLVLAGTRSAAMQFGEWTGTVVLPANANVSGQNLDNYGVAGATVRIQGAATATWLMYNTVGTTPNKGPIATTIDIPVGASLTIASTGLSTSFANTFNVIKGGGDFTVNITGNLDISDPNYSAYYLLKDVTGFTGSLSATGAGIAIGTAKPHYQTAGGRILLTLADATLAATANPTPETTVAGSYVKQVEGVYSVETYKTITFKNHDGSSLYTIADAKLGDMPVYGGETPTKAGTEQYTYTFNGWNPAIATVTGDAAYTAQFTEKEKTSSTDYKVPYSWFAEYVTEMSGSDLDELANMNAQNGLKYWQCYVLGLDPTNETSKFTVSIRMDGETPVVEYSPTNDTIAIQYVLQGKPLLNNDWQDVEFDEPGDTNRFFRVKVKW